MTERKITCIAIDDEPLALRQLEIYASKTPYIELVSSFTSAIDAKDYLSKQKVDAIFADINMPDLNGLDFVRSLSDPPLVVFATAYSEYAVEGYKVDAIDYLLKPFSLEDFQRAASKVKNQCELLHKADSQVSGTDDSIYLKMDYKVVKIKLSDIRYIEGMSEYLKIFTEDSQRPMVVLHSMKRMEERLKDTSLMRVHKSYIVNLDKIKEFSKGKITMEPPSFSKDKSVLADKIPVGDNYREKFNSYIESKFPEI